MKTIQVSDADYDLLVELSKELQSQENDSQAFPYFWHPMSTKEDIGTEDDTPMVYDSNAAECYTLSDFAENNEDVFLEFLAEEEEPENTKYEDIDEWDWQRFVEYSVDDASIVYSREVDKPEQNFSLFKDDVKNFIRCNKHHLGGDPRTYARTVWRMPKMEALVGAVYRLFPLPKNEVNHEARRFVYQE